MAPWSFGLSLRSTSSLRSEAWWSAQPTRLRTRGALRTSPPRPHPSSLALVRALTRRFAPRPKEPHWGSLGCPSPHLSLVPQSWMRPVIHRLPPVSTAVVLRCRTPAVENAPEAPPSACRIRNPRWPHRKRGTGRRGRPGDPPNASRIRLDPSAPPTRDPQTERSISSLLADPVLSTDRSHPNQGSSLGDAMSTAC